MSTANTSHTQTQTVRCLNAGTCDHRHSPNEVEEPNVTLLETRLRHHFLYIIRRRRLRCGSSRASRARQCCSVESDCTSLYLPSLLTCCFASEITRLPRSRDLSRPPNPVIIRILYSNNRPIKHQIVITSQTYPKRTTRECKKAIDCTCVHCEDISFACPPRKH